MHFLVIGDLHYGKEFSTYQRNKFVDFKQEKLWFLKTDSYLRNTINEISEFIINQKEIIKIVFVGDEVDAPMLESGIYNNFKSLVDYCILMFSDCLNSIDVVIGTHDCTSYGEAGTYLTLLDGYKNIVNVYSKPTVVKYTDDSSILYLPYRDSKNFIEYIDIDDLTILKSVKNLLIFSHNNFCFEYAGNIPLMSIVDFNKNLGISPELEIVFNGHIHNSYIKNGDNINFIQVGSISPLAFDGDICRTGGIFLYKVEEEFERFNPSIQYTNKEIMFYKIDDTNNIDKLRQLLEENEDTLFFVKYETQTKDVIEELCQQNLNIIYICKYTKELEILESEQEKSVKNEIVSQINVRHEKNVDICGLFDKYLSEKYGFIMKDV